MHPTEDLTTDTVADNADNDADDKNDKANDTDDKTTRLRVVLLRMMMVVTRITRTATAAFIGLLVVRDKEPEVIFQEH